MKKDIFAEEKVMNKKWLKLMAVRPIAFDTILLCKGE